MQATDMIKSLPTTTPTRSPPQLEQAATANSPRKSPKAPNKYTHTHTLTLSLSTDTPHVRKDEQSYVIALRLFLHSLLENTKGPSVCLSVCPKRVQKRRKMPPRRPPPSQSVP
mmetsp:Transcript_6221/g.17897  ORF Transcript_6221/g.17897 Transcript_6221/m.17897 type:complete len:113 (-) Transcript_6221:949-1287(-)